MIGPKGRCGWVHSLGLARAQGLFAGTTGYRARSGGPFRTTREAAISDECARSHDCGTETQPWIVETSSGDLLHEDPATGQWWTAAAAQQHVDQGRAAWAYPRNAIGLSN